jgi:hypothetical protein
MCTLYVVLGKKKGGSDDNGCIVWETHLNLEFVSHGSWSKPTQDYAPFLRWTNL